MPALPLSPRLLLLIYAVAPLLLLVVAIDLMTGGVLRAWLPSNPDAIFLYVLLFGAPHIVASLFSFADTTYLNHYRKKVTIGIPLIFIGFGLLVAYSLPLSFIVFVLLTEYHVMSQHQGILRMLGRAGGLYVSVWKWTGLLALALGYGLAGWEPSSYGVFIESIHGYVLVPYILVAFGLTSLFLLTKMRSREGWFFLAFSTIAVGSSFLFLVAGYPLFAIFVGRFIHDAAAFAFYIVHDENRHRAGATNLFYRLFSRTKVPIFILVPLLGIAIAYAIKQAPYISSTIFIYLSMAHYYTESFIWKRDGLHRLHIPLRS